MSFKKFLLPLIVLAVTAQSFAIDSLSHFDADKVLQYDYVRGAIPVLDTIGGTDSVVILKKPFKPTQGWNYVLTIPLITGGGTDSVKYSVITRAFDPRGTLMSTTTWAVDTIVSTPVDLLLPINRVSAGSTYEVVFKPKTGNGGQHIFTGLWVYKVSNAPAPK